MISVGAGGGCDTRQPRFESWSWHKVRHYRQRSTVRCIMGRHSQLVPRQNQLVAGRKVTPPPQASDACRGIVIEQSDRCYGDPTGTVLPVWVHSYIACVRCQHTEVI